MKDGSSTLQLLAKRTITEQEVSEWIGLLPSKKLTRWKYRNLDYVYLAALKRALSTHKQYAISRVFYPVGEWKITSIAKMPETDRYFLVSDSGISEYGLPGARPFLIAS